MRVISAEDRVTMMENIEKIRNKLKSGKTTVREEVVRRQDEMHYMNVQRIGMNKSQAKHFNKNIDFILEEIHLIRLLEAGIL